MPDEPGEGLQLVLCGCTVPKFVEVVVLLSMSIHHMRVASLSSWGLGLGFCLVEGERGSARRVGKLGTSSKMRRTSPTTMQEKREQIEKHSEFRVSTCPSVLRRCMPCWTSIYRVQISNAVRKTLPLCTIRAQVDGRTSLAHT